MRNTLLLALALLLSVTVSAQNRISYISEHFNTEDFPPGWTFEGDATADNWEIWGTHQAGGEPNEIKLYWKPSFEGVARLVSPALNLTGITEMVVSFKAFLDNYKDEAHKMGVATTSDDGATWNVAWQDSYANSNQGQHSFVKTVSTPDMGKENVKFCIFFEGTSGNINGWYFDDIEIYTLDKLNLGILSTDIPEISTTKENEIAFTVKNTGEEDITSFNASFQIDDNEAVAQNFEVNIASLQTERISFQDKINLLPGSHSLTISILNVNGEEDITSDNVLSTEINIALGSLQRKPMIEHFSSPTCAPCVAVNEAMHLLTENHQGQFTYTKYPLNFPSDGDPYYTEECKVKKTYYNVLGAPTIFLDGDLYGNIDISNQDFETRCNVPSYIDIKGAFNVNETDSTINVSVDVMPLVNLYEKRLFVSVNEKTTTGNASYNGETKFHHIMMKMLPNEEGTELDFKTCELQHFEFSYDIRKTYMEELNDLEVAVWIQDYYNFVIYNSNYMYEYTDHPFPAKSLTLTENDDEIQATWEKPEQGEPIGYNVYVNNELIAENLKELTYSFADKGGLTIVSIAAVYENEKTSVGILNSISTEAVEESIIENTSSLNIYPNPVNDKLFIETEVEIMEVSVYDVYGRKLSAVSYQLSAINVQQSLSIDVNELNSGVYFVKVSTESGEIVKRFIKK